MENEEKIRVLVLSCNTGGGHNAAGLALKECMECRNMEVHFFDYLTLAGGAVSKAVGAAYVGVVKKAPALFGIIYRIGDLVSRMVKHSPVYYVNGKMADYLAEYLKANPYDVIVMPHLFPAETITAMKRRGMKVPLTVAVATDYTCIPFWGETNCDIYITPSAEADREFEMAGVPKERLYPLGIPVSAKFCASVTREEAREKLGLVKTGRLFLIIGGSMGAGNMKKLTDEVAKRLEPEDNVLVICGNNKKLRQKLRRVYRLMPQIRIIGRTERMAWYMKAADAVFTKPGGLTSTEAAAAEAPLVHTAPIPGCETRNREYFVKKGISISGTNEWAQAARGNLLAKHRASVLRMKQAQRKWIPKDAAEQITALIRSRLKEGEKDC